MSGSLTSSDLELREKVSKTMGWWIDDGSESFDFYPERTNEVIALIETAVTRGRIDELQKAEDSNGNGLGWYYLDRIEELKTSLKQQEAENV